MSIDPAIWKLKQTLDQTMWGSHFCPIGRAKKYHSLLCSYCMGKGIDLNATYEQIDKFNLTIDQLKYLE